MKDGPPWTDGREYSVARPVPVTSTLFEAMSGFKCHSTVALESPVASAKAALERTSLLSASSIFVSDMLAPDPANGAKSTFTRHLRIKLAILQMGRIAAYRAEVKPFWGDLACDTVLTPNACAKSAIKSAESSSPTDIRTKPGTMPQALRASSSTIRWVNDAGC